MNEWGKVKTTEEKKESGYSRNLGNNEHLK